MSKMKIP